MVIVWHQHAGDRGATIELSANCGFPSRLFTSMLRVLTGSKVSMVMDERMKLISESAGATKMLSSSLLLMGRGGFGPMLLSLSSRLNHALKLVKPHVGVLHEGSGTS